MKRSFVGVLACMTVVGLSLTAGAQAEAPVQPDYKVVTGSSGDLVSDDAFDLQSAVSFLNIMRLNLFLMKMFTSI